MNILVAILEGSCSKRDTSFIHSSIFESTSFGLEIV